MTKKMITSYLMSTTLLLLIVIIPVAFGEALTVDVKRESSASSVGFARTYYTYLDGINDKKIRVVEVIGISGGERTTGDLLFNYVFLRGINFFALFPIIWIVYLTLLNVVVLFEKRNEIRNKKRALKTQGPSIYPKKKRY